MCTPMHMSCLSNVPETQNNIFCPIQQFPIQISDGVLLNIGLN
jgi:hypothetical protein